VCSAPSATPSTWQCRVRRSALHAAQHGAAHRTHSPAANSQPDCARQLRRLRNYPHVRRLPPGLTKRAAADLRARCAQVRVWRAVCQVCSVQLCHTGVWCGKRITSAASIASRARPSPQGGGGSSAAQPAGAAGGATKRSAARSLAISVSRAPAHPLTARPQQRPQMVVVENPPTMDDEGKLVRVLAQTAAVSPADPAMCAGLEHGCWCRTGQAVKSVPSAASLPMAGYTDECSCGPRMVHVSPERELVLRVRLCPLRSSFIRLPHRSQRCQRLFNL
jgi:hypothetical protein